MLIKGIMLGQVESDVRVEGADDVFDYIQLVDEGIEDLALEVFGRRGPGAVSGVGADLAAGIGAGIGAGIEARCPESDE